MGGVPVSTHGMAAKIPGEGDSSSIPRDRFMILDRNRFFMLEKVTGVPLGLALQPSRVPRTGFHELPESLPVICSALTTCRYYRQWEKNFSLRGKILQKPHRAGELFGLSISRNQPNRVPQPDDNLFGSRRSTRVKMTSK
jgi:hypothetical protein